MGVRSTGGISWKIIKHKKSLKTGKITKIMKNNNLLRGFFFLSQNFGNFASFHVFMIFFNGLHLSYWLPPTIIFMTRWYLHSVKQKKKWISYFILRFLSLRCPECLCQHRWHLGCSSHEAGSFLLTILLSAYFERLMGLLYAFFLQTLSNKVCRY